MFFGQITDFFNNVQMVVRISYRSITTVFESTKTFSARYEIMAPYYPYFITLSPPSI